MTIACWWTAGSTVGAVLLAASPAAAPAQSNEAADRGVKTVQDAIAALQGSGKPPSYRPKSYKRSMAAIAIGDVGAWFDADSYPPEALRANRQGRVVIQLGIDSAGAVATCTVMQPSGTAILDERTCALAKERGRYNPATDRRGRPTAGTATIPVRWQIPDQPTATIDAAEFGKRSITVEATYSVTGIVIACRVVAIEPADPKAAAAACPDAMIGTQAAVVTRRGAPVAYKVVRQSSVAIVPTE